MLLILAKIEGALNLVQKFVWEMIVIVLKENPILAGSTCNSPYIEPAKSERVEDRRNYKHGY